MIGIDGLVYAVLFIIVVGAVVGLLFWLIGYVEGQGMLPAPFGKVARIVLVVFCVLVAIGFLLSLIGHPIVRF